MPLDASPGKGSLRVVDLFSGCGAMSMGAKLAAESVGLAFEVQAAADFEPVALQVYQENFRPRYALKGDLRATVAFDLTADGGWTELPRILDERLAAAIGKTDLLIGGPPCQGHSDLNNHSRRDDPKNSLYLVMPAIAIALRVPIVIVENVPAVVHDRRSVVQRTALALERDGYRVSQAVIAMDHLGVAQRRKRHALVAVKGRTLNLEMLLDAIRTGPRTLAWAIRDLERHPATGVFDSASVQSPANRRRISRLLDDDLYDLPNEDRPPCHRDKSHSYVSMYGRMHWDEPAQTITSGFGSPGQGRYVHPKAPRTLTPHEASRIQFFPDSFRFGQRHSTPKRTQLAVMIGNAVPPKLSYALTLGAIARTALVDANGRVRFRGRADGTP